MTRSEILARIREEGRLIPRLTGEARKTAVAYRKILLVLLRFTPERRESVKERAA